MKKMHYLIRFAITLMLAGIITSCGNDSEAPADGEILINPTDYNVSISHEIATLPACVPEVINVPYVITVFDTFGRELGGVDVTIELGFAPGSATPGLNTLFLYDSDDTQTPLTLVNSPFNTTTEPNGQKHVVVQLLTGCALGYQTQMTVTSGSIVEASDIDVSSPGF